LEKTASGYNVLAFSFPVNTVMVSPIPFSSVGEEGGKNTFVQLANTAKLNTTYKGVHFLKKYFIGSPPIEP